MSIKRIAGSVEPNEYDWEQQFGDLSELQPYTKVDTGKLNGLAVAYQELLAEPAVPVSEIDVRDRIVTFIMEHYNDTPEDGHFWFDIHDAAELLEEIDKAKVGE